VLDKFWVPPPAVGDEDSDGGGGGGGGGGIDTFVIIGIVAAVVVGVVVGPIMVVMIRKRRAKVGGVPAPSTQDDVTCCSGWRILSSSNIVRPDRYSLKGDQPEEEASPASSSTVQNPLAKPSGKKTRTLQPAKPPAKSKAGFDSFEP